MVVIVPGDFPDENTSTSAAGHQQNLLRRINNSVILFARWQQIFWICDMKNILITPFLHLTPGPTRFTTEIARNIGRRNISKWLIPISWDGPPLCLISIALETRKTETRQRRLDSSPSFINIKTNTDCRTRWTLWAGSCPEEYFI